MGNWQNTTALVLGSVLSTCSFALAAGAATPGDDSQTAGRQTVVITASRVASTQNFSQFRSAGPVTYQGNVSRLASTRQVNGGISCVPYARRVSGIELIGNAWQWWGNAEGRYARGRIPEFGSVLAFRSNGRMRLGHVAVVSRIINAREIEIDHANWGIYRGAITRGVPVVDVSPANNWTAVRVGLPRSSDFGSVYPTHGFIYDRPDNGVVVAQDAAPAPTPVLNPIPSDLRPVAERPWQMYEEVAEAPSRAGAPHRPLPVVIDRR